MTAGVRKHLQAVFSSRPSDSECQRVSETQNDSPIADAGTDRAEAAAWGRSVHAEPDAKAVYIVVLVTCRTSVLRGSAVACRA